MKDALGNTLAVGHMVMWNNLPVHITKIVEADEKKKTPAMINFSFVIASPDPRSIVRVVDPESEQFLNKAMGA